MDIRYGLMQFTNVIFNTYVAKILTCYICQGLFIVKNKLISDKSCKSRETSTKLNSKRKVPHLLLNNITMNILRIPFNCEDRRTFEKR